MAVSSYPFDGQATTETQYSKLFRELQDSGVASSEGSNDFKVTADASGMNVQVTPGFAIVRGHAVESTATEVLPIAASGSSTRTDRVVLRLDPTANSITLAVLTGVPGGGAPAPTQTDTTIYELSLGTVTVGANVTNIASSAVADDRRYVGSNVGVWSSATRPSSPRKGRTGMNVTTGVFENWNGSAWEDLLAWAKISGKPATYPPSTHTHDVSGATVTYAASAGDADTVDGQHASSFAGSGHNHNGVYSGVGHGHDVSGASVNYANSAGIASAVGSSGGGYSASLSWNGLNLSKLAGAAGSYCRIDGAGNFYNGGTSNRRLKMDIEDAEVSVQGVLALRPRTFRFDPEADGVDEVLAGLPLQFGLIAEEVDEAGVEELVGRDADGNVAGVHYDLVGLALLPVVQAQEDRIRALEDLVAELMDR